MSKVSAEEQAVTERIFQLNVSLQLLIRAQLPFHKEAIGMIKGRIKKLKDEPIPSRKNFHTHKQQK
jgi:hypothetical protein